jgi:DNA-directed RNA polymerase subunit E"
VVKTLRACRKCAYVTEEDTCPRCGEATSKEWQGYVIILDHQKSEIAKKLNINANGKYALRVR